MMPTPLAYFGGKQNLAPQIVRMFPEHRFYLEAFAGGAAVFFHKSRAKRETLNDLDGTIQNFWRVVRDHPEELAERVFSTPYSRTEWNLASASEVEEGIEGARKLLVEVDQSFGRMRGSWSPPSLNGRWQPGSWDGLPERIVWAAERLKGVSIECSDGVDLIPRFDVPGAFIYCDPPYAPEARRSPNVYKVDADEDLWSRLANTLSSLKHALVVVSGYPCEPMEHLGWPRHPIGSRRSATPGPGQREWTEESLWMNYEKGNSLF